MLVHLHDGGQPPPLEWAGVHLRQLKPVCVFETLSNHIHGGNSVQDP